MSQDARNVIEKGAAAIRAHFGSGLPETVLVLGSGIGRFAENLEGAKSLSYAEIPGFAASTVAGHAGRLMVGHVGGRKLAIMAGRIHVYEGHPPQAIATLVRILKAAGAGRLLLTNASGGLHPDMEAGTLMIVTDHINFSGINPLIGPNDEAVGPRFPDLTDAYDPQMRVQLRKAADAAGLAVKEGVYLYCTGPNFETPAEIRMFGKLGAQVVGMSTVPETIAARHCGLRIAAVSLVTNLAAGLSAHPLTHEETLEEARKAYGKMEKLLLGFLALG
jgi:inosine/guanosine/xanthosine phosphorylase family protein